MKGPDAEKVAADYLAQQGLTLTARNYRCRFGEIDIIAEEGTTLVFAEVRSRSSSRYGGAAESITATKQLRILRAARHYLAHAGRQARCRFDVLLIEGDPPAIEWIRDAFSE